MMITKGTRFDILDQGYVKLIDFMGDEESIIDAARMSTGKGFIAWGAYETCKKCGAAWRRNTDPINTFTLLSERAHECCDNVIMDLAPQAGDAFLLEYLYSNRHMTPFEMCELLIEVEAPIMVFREWHRHRTQSFNEFSARYAVMPNKHYVPLASRIARQSKKNKQGSGEAYSLDEAQFICKSLADEQTSTYAHYEKLIGQGVANEIARINTPVSRYSKMRAKANLRNWLQFLSLRMDLNAQKEIREFANAVGTIIRSLWPQTYQLWVENDFYATRFSRSEMMVLRAIMSSPDLLRVVDTGSRTIDMSPKKIAALKTKLTTDKATDYEGIEALRGL